MIELGQYEAIDDDAEEEEVLTSINEPITIKVLQQETSALISTLSVSNTVGDLKQAVQKAHRVPIAQQRLIFSGKPLAPDSKNLSSFSIKDQSVVHLFPRPVASSAPEQNSQEHQSVRDIRSYDNSDPFMVGHLPIHFDDQVGQSIREVKMWCYILVIVSAMTLFSNFSYLGATGNAGNGTFDSTVNIIESICCMAGLYVGQLGLKSTVEVEIGLVKRYASSLCVLAACTICLRVVWVADVVLLAKKELRESHEEEGAGGDDTGDDNSIGGGSKEDGTYGDDDDAVDEPQMSDRSFMIYFSIQAVIMAGIIIAMWVTCATRALRFRRAVESYEGISNSRA